MIEAGLYTHLTTDAGVSALIGTRLYPLIMPQDETTPASTYQRVSTTPTYAHGGDCSVDMVRIQIDNYAESLLAAKTLAAAVRTALSGYSGAMGAATVQALFMDSERDFDDPTTDLFRVTQDFLITFKE